MGGWVWVDERIWRPALAQADRAGRLIGEMGAVGFGPGRLGTTLGERLAETQEAQKGVLLKIGRRTNQPGRCSHHRCGGRCHHGEYSRLQLFQRLIVINPIRPGWSMPWSFDDGKAHHVRGQRLNLGADLGPCWRRCRPAQRWRVGAIGRSLSLATMRENTMKIAHCLYEATAWIYGRGAFRPFESHGP